MIKEDEPMLKDDVLPIFREGMPKLNGIQQEAIDRAIYYLEHHPMD